MSTQKTTQSVSAIRWQLKSGLDRRFRSGHPWVFSNELSASPKGIQPGAPVELVDQQGNFLAWGYGSPSSLISFREFSRHPEESDALEVSGLLRRFRFCLELRVAAGLLDSSFRWVFGESDGLPGLILDRYLLADEKSQSALSTGAQVLVLQAHTAGIERLKPVILEALEAFLRNEEKRLGSWDQTAIVIRDDVSTRKLEGLSAPEEGTTVVRDPLGVLKSSEQRIRVLDPLHPGPGSVAGFWCDLKSGQKTGFFLDQRTNVGIATQLLKSAFAGQKKLRILDLCTYVGQWSTRLVGAAQGMGMETLEVTLVDASARALALASRNVAQWGVESRTIQGDVLKDLKVLADESFDVVIADPPAFVKSRKDIGPGSHAYLQLNTQAIRVLKRKGGLLVSCSCSAQFDEETMQKTLAKAAQRNRSFVRYVARGGMTPDHPMRPEFPEGHYLKAWYGITGSVL